MAKRHHITDKVYDFKVNLGCLVLALILFVMAAYGFSLLSGDLDIGGISIMLDNAEDVLETLTESFESAPRMDLLFALIFIAACEIINLIVIINLIRMFLGWFGFIGKRDSRRMAVKLAKHAKIAFGSMGLIITELLFATLDEGVIPENIKTYFILVGVVLLLTYLLVRFYRWFVVERYYVTDFIFTLIKDLAFLALPILLFSMISKTVMGDLFDGFTKMVQTLSWDTTNFLGMAVVAELFEALIGLIMFFYTISIVRKLMKFVPFNNYRKSYSAKVNGRMVGMIILTALVVVSSGITSVAIATGTVDVSGIVDALLLKKDLLIQLLLITIGTFVLGGVDKSSDILDVKLAAPRAKAEPVEEVIAAPAAPVVEAPIVEEAPVVEEAPAPKKTTTRKRTTTAKKADTEE